MEWTLDIGTIALIIGVSGAIGFYFGNRSGEHYGKTIGYAKGVEDGLKGKDIYLGSREDA